MHVHCLVDLLWRELAMYLLHSLAGPLHRRKSLSVDIRRLDGIYLLVKRADLSQCLLKAVLVLLFASESRLRSCCPGHGQSPSTSHELICGITYHFCSSSPSS